VEIHNKEIERQTHDLSKIVLSQEGETWLVRIYKQPKIVEVLISEQVGCDILELETIIQDSLEALIMQVTLLPDWDAHNCEIAEEREVHVAEVQAPPMTRSSSRLKRAKLGQNVSKDSEPTSNMSAKGSLIPVATEKSGSSKPEVIVPESSTFNQFEIESIVSWIGKQLENQKIPPNILSTVIKTHDNYPDGLLAIRSTKGGPHRIIVPLAAQENLVNQAHVDILATLRRYCVHSTLVPVVVPIFVVIYRI
jgi:hypothetical protein